MAVQDPVAITKALHPLSVLTAEEIVAAANIVRDSGRLAEKGRFASLTLREPSKDIVRSFRPGDPIDREVRVQVINGPGASVVEAVVSVTHSELRSWEQVDNVRPALMMEEAMRAIKAIKANEAWQAAMRRRGIEDFERVQVDPWPAGTFNLVHEENRRISKCLSYWREHSEDNGYARPIEGVIGIVDMGRAEVLEIIDTGVVPVPSEPGSYLPEDHEPLRADLKALEITQPDGPSFSVEGNLICWQKWALRISMHPLEGLVIHTVTYEDKGQARPILYRASVTEMVVPYGDPGPMHSWKSAFDVGEWGLGRMANSLTLGCDCVGEIRYFDFDFADERGNAHTLVNGVCLHEEDYGILWKHADLLTGRVEVRRSRRLVVSSIATVGNYEYGFYWYFYLDGTIQLEVKLTGIMSTMGIEPGAHPTHASVIAPGLAAPYHQHLFNVRLDMEVDGPNNSIYEMGAHPSPIGADNPWGNAFLSHARLLETERQAIGDVDPASSRSWKIVNPSTTNRLGAPVAYKLVPVATPTLLADPDSSVGRRARFATHNLWVTPFDEDERRAAGDYPNQHAGLDGLPAWTQADRAIVDTDIVLWHSFGVTHIPRPEDWPVMPVEYTGFSLIPTGFFDANPALDVPPSSNGHCHGG
jgi:primary-amine oxidase